MAKSKKKMQAKLAMRIASHEEMARRSKGGGKEYIRPGSQNSKKN